MDGVFFPPQGMKNTILTQRKEETMKRIEIKEEIENIIYKPLLRAHSNFTGKFYRSSGEKIIPL